jgi:RNA polymerase sigma factor (sigma-70 family)
LKPEYQQLEKPWKNECLISHSAALKCQMADVSDMELLRDYNEQVSEEAFAALVQRHVNLVYSVALRHAGIAAHAEEITQAVFVILARKAATLRPDTVLEGWLHETTRLTALQFMRGERRRQFREQEAYMQTTLRESTDASVWMQLAPLLDDALSRLGQKDRNAVMLRYFKDKSVREVAAALRVSEGAAQRRVLRAVEKLRLYFTKHGVVHSAAVLTAAISSHSVQTAPETLAQTVTAAAMAKGAAASGSTLTLSKGALKIMAWTKTKTAAVAGMGLLLAGGILTGILCRHTIAHRIAVARGELAISRHEAAPIDLANTIARYGWPAERFDQIKRFPMWQSVPRGFQVFDHVPFQINGAFALWGESNVRQTHINFPEQIPDIAVNQKFATLYMLHMAFFSEPYNTPVYEVVFHYEDGLTATNQLLYGDDILEWGLNKHGRAIGPAGPNSKLAWAGGSGPSQDKNPVRVCLTAVENPMPLTKVTSIDLNSCKSQSAGCILAMTTGRSRLMQ